MNREEVTIIFILFYHALLVLIILFLVVFIVEKGLNKLLGVKKQKISRTPGKNVDRRGKTIIVIPFLVAIPFVVLSESSAAMKGFWILYMIILIGFQAFLEWKYLKNSKQYITTLVILVFAVVFIYNLEKFFWFL